MACIDQTTPNKPFIINGLSPAALQAMIIKNKTSKALLTKSSNGQETRTVSVKRRLDFPSTTKNAIIKTESTSSAIEKNKSGMTLPTNQNNQRSGTTAPVKCTINELPSVPSAIKTSDMKFKNSSSVLSFNGCNNGGVCVTPKQETLPITPSTPSAIKTSDMKSKNSSSVLSAKGCNNGGVYVSPKQVTLPITPSAPTAIKTSDMKFKNSSSALSAKSCNNGGVSTEPVTSPISPSAISNVNTQFVNFTSPKKSCITYPTTQETLMKNTVELLKRNDKIQNVSPGQSTSLSSKQNIINSSTPLAINNVNTQFVNATSPKKSCITYPTTQETLMKNTLELSKRNGTIQNALPERSTSLNSKQNIIISSTPSAINNVNTQFVNTTSPRKSCITYPTTQETLMNNTVELLKRNETIQNVLSGQSTPLSSKQNIISSSTPSAINNVNTQFVNTTSPRKSCITYPTTQETLMKNTLELLKRNGTIQNALPERSTSLSSKQNIINSSTPSAINNVNTQFVNTTSPRKSCITYPTTQETSIKNAMELSKGNGTIKTINMEQSTPSSFKKNIINSPRSSTINKVNTGSVNSASPRKSVMIYPSLPEKSINIAMELSERNGEIQNAYTGATNSGMTSSTVVTNNQQIKPSIELIRVFSIPIPPEENSKLPDIAPIVPTKIAHASTKIKEDNPFDEYETMEELLYNIYQQKRHLQGRKIVDVDYLINETSRAQLLHSYKCPDGTLKVYGEEKLGLASSIILKCDTCREFCDVTTEKAPDQKINQLLSLKSLVNRNFVWACYAAASHFSQAETLMNALEIEVTPLHLNKVETELGKCLEESLTESMKRAGEMERKIAVKKNQISPDGTPWIYVHCDGSWSKRAYGHSYNSPSGMAVIIGKETKKILYIGVRNKRCSICYYAAKKHTPARFHECFKNYKGSSFGMEPEIIVEGFKRSIETHGVKYLRIIADGDSCTFAKVKKEVPYGDEVEKIECVNHLMKNIGKQLKKMKTDTKLPVEVRKLLTNNKIKLIQQVIMHVSKVNDNVEELKKDISNVIDHVYENHTNCNVKYCESVGINKQKEGFNILGIKTAIRVPLKKVLSKADHFLLSESNNIAECFMSMVAKYNCAKRINFTQRGSYQRRTHYAGLMFNEGHKWQPECYKKFTNVDIGDVYAQFLVACHKRSGKRRFENLELINDETNGKPSDCPSTTKQNNNENDTSTKTEQNENRKEKRAKIVRQNYKEDVVKTYEKIHLHTPIK